jgi:hypothetical protein
MNCIIVLFRLLCTNLDGLFFFMICKHTRLYMDGIFIIFFSNITSIFLCNTASTELLQVYLEKRMKSVLSKSNGSMSLQLHSRACLVRLRFYDSAILKFSVVLRF